MEIGSGPFERPDQGGIDVPRFVRAGGAKPSLELGWMRAWPWAPPTESSHEAVPGRRSAPNSAESLARTPSVPVGTCRQSGDVAMSSMIRISAVVSRCGDVRG